MQKALGIIITTKGPPQTTPELRRIRYKGFKNLGNLLLSYATYYYETRKSENNATIACKTCKKEFTIETRLAIRRTTPPTVALTTGPTKKHSINAICTDATNTSK